MMRKLLPMLILPLMLAGCAKEKNREVPIELDRNELTLKANDSYNLKIVAGNKEDVKWQSNKPFVATVSQTGEVKAHRVGEAMITANNTPCMVRVNAMVDLYIEPFTTWKTSRSTFIDLKGQPSREEDEGKTLIYATNSPTKPEEIYKFDSYNLLYSSSVLIGRSREEFLYPFLDERYFKLDNPDIFTVRYANGFSTQDATMLIGVRDYNKDMNYFEVVYIGNK